MKNQDFIKQIREMSLTDLAKKLDQVMAEKEQARLKQTVGKLKNTSLVKTLSHQVAQVRTVIKEKQLQHDTISKEETKTGSPDKISSK